MADGGNAAVRLHIDRWPVEFREEWDERAAIIEYDGKQPRENAELMAFTQIMKANHGDKRLK